MKAAVVSGAAGFVGSHLVDALLESGYVVCGIDNLITGDLANLSGARQSSAFHFIEADISGNGDALREHIERESGGEPTIVFHLASPASPVDYAALPVETMLANSRGTQVCLELSKAWGAKFLFASTSESYGDPLEHPQRETYWGNVNPVGPRSCYDESKRFGEALVMAYLRISAVDARIVRIFNTYGPRMRRNDGRVVPNFIAQAVSGHPLTIYGDGEQTRAFCYVDDLVRGIMLCAESSKTVGLVVNLGNPEEHTIRSFAEIVCEIANVPLRLEHLDLPPDDPTRRCPDISRARQLVGWEPLIPLREGLRRTIEAYRVTAVPR